MKKTSKKWKNFQKTEKTSRKWKKKEMKKTSKKWKKTSKKWKYFEKMKKLRENEKTSKQWKNFEKMKNFDKKKKKLRKKVIYKKPTLSKMVELRVSKVANSSPKVVNSNFSENVPIVLINFALAAFRSFVRKDFEKLSKISMDKVPKIPPKTRINEL